MSTHRPPSTSPLSVQRWLVLLGWLPVLITPALVPAAEAQPVHAHLDRTSPGQTAPEPGSDAKSPVPIPSGMTFTKDVQYGTAAGQTLTLDSYVPGGAGPFPALVMIHGGGFVAGDKYGLEPIAVFFAQHGYACFSINYRLAPAFPYPAAVQDAEQAVRFVREHAGDYRTDPNRIGAFGASAGATIAASVGVETQGALTSGSRVAAVVSWSAAFDFRRIIATRPSAVGAIEKYAGILGKRRTRLVGADQEQALLEKAEPLTYSSPDDPPFFIANSQSEFMPLDQAQEMADALKAGGVTVEMLTDTHGHALSYTDQAEQPSLKFLDTHVRDLVVPSPEPPKGSKHGPGMLLLVGAGALLLALVLGGRALYARRQSAVYRR
jgi:acetyl esterase